MRCPYCGAANPAPVARCQGCNSDLPLPVCSACGIAVDWGETLCFRCSSLGSDQSDTGRHERGGSWRFLGEQTRMIGRIKELHQLNEVFRNVAESSQVALVTISGLPGIGKTRLASTFARQLDERCERFTVARGSARDGQRTHYWLFRSLIADRFYLGESADAEVVKRQLMDGVRSIVGPTASTELVHLIGHLGGLDFPDSPYLDAQGSSPQQLRERACAAMARLLKADALQAPLVLILDDVHLASDACFDLIQYLVSNVSEAPLLIVCLAQPALFERCPEWGEGMPLHQRIELQPLADNEIEELFHSLLKEVPELPRPLCDLAAARAMGNPLTLEHVARILLEKGVIVSSGPLWQVHMERLDPGQIPGSFNELVQARLAGLSDEERRVLQLAAVVGSSFWFGTLLVLQQLDADGWPEEQRYWRSDVRRDALRQVLRQLARKDLVRRVRSSSIPNDSEYQFKHRLERDLLYAQLDDGERTTYHKMVAQWLEMGLARRADPMVEAVALHHELGKNTKKAAYFYIHAGDRCRERYANAQAIELYQKGLAFLTEEDAVAKIEACHNLGNVYALIGNHEEALCYFREMLRHAWLIANPAKGGVAYEKMGQVYRKLGEHPFAMEHFQKALALFEEEGDVRGIAATLDDIGRVHWMQGNLELALKNHQDSLALRRELKDPRSIALALSHIGAVRIARGQMAEALEALHESLELRRQVGDRRGEAESLNAFGAIFFERGHPDRAVKMWEEGIALSRSTGDREILSYLLNNIGEALIEMGQLEDALVRLEEALSVCSETQILRARATVLRNLGRVSLTRKDGAQARRYAEEALAISRRVGLKVVEGQALCLLGEIASQTLFATEGSPEHEAETCFAGALTLLEEVGNAAELERALTLFASFLRERGRTPEAEERESKARAIAEQLKKG